MVIRTRSSTRKTKRLDATKRHLLTPAHYSKPKPAAASRKSKKAEKVMSSEPAAAPPVDILLPLDATAGQWYEDVPLDIDITVAGIDDAPLLQDVCGDDWVKDFLTGETPVSEASTAGSDACGTDFTEEPEVDLFCHEPAKNAVYRRTARERRRCRRRRHNVTFFVSQNQLIPPPQMMANLFAPVPV